MQSSILLAHSSHATRCRHGRNNVCTRACLHFRQVISERSRSFSFFSLALSKTCVNNKRAETFVKGSYYGEYSTAQNHFKNAMLRGHTVINYFRHSLMNGQRGARTW